MMKRLIHFIRYRIDSRYRLAYDCQKLWVQVMLASGSITEV
jgi:hypothetical protein